MVCSIFKLQLYIFHFHLPAAPRVTAITDEGCTVDWSPIKPISSRDHSSSNMAGANSELQYQVQLTPRARESDAKIVSYYTSNYKTNKLVGWKISQ